MWMMGTGLGLDCNYDPPRVIEHPNGRLNESAATLSTATGELQYYSDNLTVWNADHGMIANGDGLNGDKSAHRGVVFVPAVSDSNLIYIFNQKSQYENGTLYYSIIDKRYDEGKGGIILSKKNIELATDLAEGIFVIKGECGKLWLICRKSSTQEILAYPIDKNGVGSAVISSVVPRRVIEIQNKNYIVGYATMFLYSYGEEKLVMTSAQEAIVIYDFDRNTGKVTSPVLLSLDTLYQSTRNVNYSVLSKNERYLLFGEARSPKREVTTFYSYDISLPDTLIHISKRKIGKVKTNFNGTGDMMKPPMSADIYFTYLNPLPDNVSPRLLTYYMGKLKSVDDTSFVVIDSAISIPRLVLRTTNFTNPVVKADPISSTPIGVSDTTLCGSAIEISIADSIDALTSVNWSNGSTGERLIISEPGDYWVEVDELGCKLRDTFVVMDGRIGLDRLSDTVICGGGSWSIELPSAYEYEWVDIYRDSLLGTDNEYTISRSGSYELLAVSSSGCEYRDTISVDVLDSVSVDVGPDVSLCPGESVTLSAGISAERYMWSTGATTSVIDAIDPGVYVVNVWSSGCRVTDTVFVTAASGCDCSVYIPNAASPKSGDNNKWGLISSCYMRDIRIRIYDRWGGHLYERREIGPVQSVDTDVSDFSTGVYTYVLEYEMDGERQESVGTFVVIR